MMPIKVGDKVKVHTRKRSDRARTEKRGDMVMTSYDTKKFSPMDEDVIYRVAGEDHMKRIWLSAEAKEYDGYNGDVILFPIDAKTQEYEVQLADERNAFGFEVRLVKILFEDPRDGEP